MSVLSGALLHKNAFITLSSSRSLFCPGCSFCSCAYSTLFLIPMDDEQDEMQWKHVSGVHCSMFISWTLIVKMFNPALEIHASDH